MSEAGAEGVVSTADAIAIGLKVVEMADRVKAVHTMVPGARAVWTFEIDGERFRIVVEQERPHE